jgi:ubiquinone/menaquinone biosynthesis C-methylase UbiE
MTSQPETPAREIRPSDEQYTPIAADYTISPIHSQGADLQRMVELAALPVGATVLDIGTGTGHTAIAFASAGAQVTGLDLTRAMLAEAQRLSQERGVSLEAVQGLAERLPFASASFDAIACRFCAHHFMDIEESIREMRRVLRPGGVLMFDDHVAPEDDAADAFVNRLDWLRDPSHRREPRLSEYQQWFANVGLTVEHVEQRRLRIEADQWFARARTSPEREAEARSMLAHAPAPLRDLFDVADDPVAFDLHAIIMRATAERSA